MNMITLRNSIKAQPFSVPDQVLSISRIIQSTVNSKSKRMKTFKDTTNLNIMFRCANP